MIIFNLELENNHVWIASDRMSGLGCRGQGCMLMPNVWIWLEIKGICYNLGKAMRGYNVRSWLCLLLLRTENLSLLVIVGTTYATALKLSLSCSAQWSNTAQTTCGLGYQGHSGVLGILIFFFDLALNPILGYVPQIEFIGGGQSKHS